MQHGDELAQRLSAAGEEQGASPACQPGTGEVCSQSRAAGTCRQEMGLWQVLSTSSLPHTALPTAHRLRGVCYNLPSTLIPSALSATVNCRAEILGAGWNVPALKMWAVFLVNIARTMQWENYSWRLYCIRYHKSMRSHLKERRGYAWVICKSYSTAGDWITISMSYNGPSLCLRINGWRVK